MQNVIPKIPHKPTKKIPHLFTLIYTHPHLFYTYNHTHPQIFLKFSKFFSKISPYNRKFPQIFSKISQKDKIPPPSLYFQCFEALFLLYFGRGLEKICKFFPQKIFFMLQFHLYLNLLGKRMVNLERNLL